MSPAERPDGATTSAEEGAQRQEGHTIPEPGHPEDDAGLGVAYARHGGSSAVAMPLEPLRFALRGSHLIEASAGTGKTYTIATLYVRLVLGHGGEAYGFGRELTPPEILVVTFTEAATRELRDRIRRRLADAATGFREPADMPLGDGTLEALRQEYSEEQWPGCARRLELAAEWMDEAAVSTIHGWCYRMLREHAFDSGSLFRQELEADTSALLLEVAQDYWRTWIVDLGLDALPAWQAYWPDPAALARALQPQLSEAGELPSPAGGPADILEAAARRRRERLAELKQPWQDGGAALGLGEWLDSARRVKAFAGRSLTQAYQARWLGLLEAWASDPQAESVDLKTGWRRLTPEGMAEIWQGADTPSHPALALVAALQPALAALPEPRGNLYAHAMAWCAARLSQTQRQRAQLGFDGLLQQLDQALRSELGPSLVQRIRQSFPVALIDEFQDTDAVQYRIFDTLYQVKANDPATALVLIGDPKQAIYAFRGADIHTYLRARDACGGRLHTLGRNFRSTRAAVAAVNQIFLGAEQRSRGGAFQLEHDGGPAIPFQPVQARGLEAALEIDGTTPAGITLWVDAGAAAEDLVGDSGEAGGSVFIETIDITSASGSDSAGGGKRPANARAGAAHAAGKLEIAEVAAGQVARWLRLALEGRAGFRHPSEPWRPLTPADIAILVNTGTEAARIRQALAARGVRSVYLSDRSSVYHTAEAADLQRVLQACAEPERPGAVRAALATRTLGLPWLGLWQLQQDELAWEEQVQRFHGYRQDWRRLGVLPMLYRLLHDFGVPARLLEHEAEEGGERRLTDWLHLAELLQEASVGLDGEHALIRFLAEQRAEVVQDQGHQLRLESDADCVRVVTVHKSKGLEYPLVLLPFGCAARSLRRAPRRWPLAYRDRSGRRRFLWQPDAERQAEADGERLAEDVRKLYVALTRARHATWVGLAPAAADWRESALGCLLDVGTADEARVLADQTAVAQADAPSDSAAVLAWHRLDGTEDDRYRPPAGHDRTPHWRRVSRAPAEPWWVASYSALTLRAGAPGVEEGLETPADEPPLADSEWESPEAANFREDWSALEGDDSERADDAVASLPPAVAHDVWHAFPRGPEAGTLLHSMLESVAAGGFAAMADDRPALRDRVARLAAPRRLEGWIDSLTDALQGLLRQPWHLPGSELPFTLAGTAQWLVEMEFWLPVNHAPLVTLDRAIQRAAWPGRPRPALEPGLLNGMLKGFIDLVFVHDGRYYVADYKSNWLGRSAAAYTDDALGQAMAEARYDVQAMLYLLALHRLLATRLPDYDYDRHLGGAVYWFLRGVAGPARGMTALRPSRAWMEAFDAVFQGQPWVAPEDDA